MSSRKVRRSIAACWCSEVLTAEGPAPGPAPRAHDGRMRNPAAASAIVHAALLASLLVSWRPASGPSAMKPLEVEMILSAAMSPGDMPALPQPPPQEGVGPTAPKPPPPVNIGNGPDRNDPLRVTGDNVVPPEPDSRFRNQPPPYPADAARIGAEGTVQLMISVSAQGVPMGVRIVQSSGNQSLDAAARRAVQLWRFRPAIEAGRPVPFDYVLNIRFALGDHP